MSKKEIDEIRKNHEAFKFQYTVNQQNQVCDYSETIGPTIDILLAHIDKLEVVLRYYADEHEWLDYKAYARVGNKLCRVDSHFDGDNGKRAREALGEE